MAGDEDAGLIVLNRSGEELVSIAADAMLFLAVLLLLYGALQLGAIADVEAERLQLERQEMDADVMETGVFVRCDWTLDDREIQVRMGNAGDRSVLIDAVTVAARDTGGVGYVDGANLTTTLFLPAGTQKTVFLARDRFDGEMVQGVTLDLVADAPPLHDRSRVRVTERCSEAADGFLRVP